MCLGAETPPAPALADVRSTPRGSVIGFLNACREDDYRRAASFLALGRNQSATAPALAQEFKDVLSHTLTIDPARLSDRPEGDLADGLEPHFESLGTTSLRGRKVELLLERVNREGQQLWLVSSSTVQLVPVLHDALDSNPWIERLPEWMRTSGVLDTAVWQWLALLLLTGVALLFANLLSRLAMRLLRPVVARTPTDLDDALIGSIKNPMRLLIALVAYRAGLAWVAPSILLRTYLGRLLTAVLYFAAAWLLVRIIDVIATKALAAMTRQHRASASSVVPLLRRTAKVAFAVFAFLATLSSWGYNTTTLLTGLGIGGVAIALAAQKTIENLFGGLAVATDKPVLVGDFCRYGDRFGTVEDIGLRSTRIRTLDRTVVTVPNGQFSSMEIENFGRRDKIWFHPVLRVRLDATPDQVRYLIRDLKQVLLTQPKVDPEGARVRLIGISQYSLDLEVFCYVLTSNYDEFLPLQQDLYLAFMDVLEKSGARLAIPVQENLLKRA